MYKVKILATLSCKTRFQFSRYFSGKPAPFPSLPTCIALLQSCAKNQELSKGIQLHALMLISGYLTSPSSATSLINMYSKCNSIFYAFSVFRSSTQIHNVFVYNAIIGGFVVNDLSIEAFELYREMRMFGIVPDKFTFPVVIKACFDDGNLKNVHGLLFKLGLELDLFIGSAMVHRYLNFGLINEAVDMFEELPTRDDIVLWNAMINGYMQIGEFEKALVIFGGMRDTGVIPNEFTVTGVFPAIALAGEVNNGRSLHAFAIKMGYDKWIQVLNAGIDMYGKCGQLADALTVFENMVEKDTYSWNSIITVHVQCGDHEGTLWFLKGMLSFGFLPDLVTVTAAFPACAHLGALRHGKEIHGHMIVSGLDKARDTYIVNAIMDMYAKCGSMRDARLVFDHMGMKDVASWNIMVLGYGMHGFGNESLDLFSRMCEVGLKPDGVSFIGVLAACGHTGFITRGQELLAEMQMKYDVTPTIEHYGCVIDMLGRAGKLEEAFELMLNMPIEPNQVVWRSFLAACQLHGNAHLAEVAAGQVLELEPEHCGNYVLMSNVFGAAGKFEEVAELRHVMRQQDVKKSPGCSWIELSNVIHVFFTGDREHPEDFSIYDGLDSLTACLREHAHVLDAMESCL